MPKRKTKSRIPKTITLSTQTLILFSVLLLTVAVAFLFIKDDSEATREEAINISLGKLQYSIENDRATEREDETTESLRNYLEQRAEKNLSLGCTTVNYSVMAHTEDESQVLLRYGCNHPTARTFLVRSGSTWEGVSPTNQFDAFGIPKCEHVEDNGISKEIAPVCVNGWGSGSLDDVQYQIR